MGNRSLLVPGATVFALAQPIDGGAGRCRHRGDAHGDARIRPGHLGVQEACDGTKRVERQAADVERGRDRRLTIAG